MCVISHLQLDEPLDQDFSKYMNSLFVFNRVSFDVKKLKSYFGEENINKNSYYGDSGKKWRILRYCKSVR